MSEISYINKKQIIYKATKKKTTDKIEIALISLVKQRIELYTPGIFSMALNMYAFSQLKF